MIEYFDLHCDTLTEYYKKGYTMYDKNLAVQLNDFKSFERRGQVFAIWMNDRQKNPFNIYKKIIDNARYNFQANNKEVVFCQNGKDLKKADADKKLAAILSLEGGAVLEKLPERVFKLYDDGVRSLNLCWNFKSGLAGGVESRGRLTKYGKSTIKNMNKCGMALDLSHLNKKSFYPAIENADIVLASHSNAHKICNHERNLTERQLKLIKEKNGIIGICFFPEFLGSGNVMENIYKQITYMLELDLKDNISFGSDFDGAKMDERLKGVRNIQTLYEYLSTKNFDDNTINKIFYQNARNFYDKLLTNHQK
ncbi:MAG: membrane dipeptidase [Oscillospiraceae bacterium]